MSTSVVAVHRDPDSLPRGQQERRERIVRAAITLLEQGEYDAIQIRDVAQEAGVALGTVYRYFTSKEHLYAAALLEWAANFPTREPSKRADGRSDEAQLRALMRRAVRAFERYPQMMRVEIVIESSPDPNARRAVRSVRGPQRGHAQERAFLDPTGNGGGHRRDGQQRARDTPASVGARARHHRRRRPLGTEDARPDLRAPFLSESRLLLLTFL